MSSVNKLKARQGSQRDNSPSMYNTILVVMVSYIYMYIYYKYMYTGKLYIVYCVIVTLCTVHCTVP